MSKANIKQHLFDSVMPDPCTTQQSLLLRDNTYSCFIFVTVYLWLFFFNLLEILGPSLISFPI